MSRRLLSILFCVLLSSVAAVAQQKPPAGADPEDQRPKVWMGDQSASVAANQAVLTVPGVCQQGIGDSKGQRGTPDCSTTITREQFEKLVAAVNSNNQQLSPAVLRRLADGLAEILVWADAATKAGVENDPMFVETLKIARVRTLRDIYVRELQEQYRKPGDQEIQNYYNQNGAKFTEVKLERVFIPKNNPAGNDAGYEAKAQQAAVALRERAVKGEAMDALQKEAYKMLALTSTPPAADAGTRKAGTMTPAEEQEIFALQPGQVSKVETEPSGFIFYKVVSKQTAPLTQVKEQIARDLFQQNMQAKVKAINASAKPQLNDQYFGPATGITEAPSAPK
jgi:parvulin-like peptidyl-prolyl isomerase